MANIHDVNESLQVQPSVRNLPTLIALSQGENGRSLQFRMVGATIPSGSSVSLSGTKPDGVVYSKAGTVDGNTVIFQEDVQLTAVAGAWDAKIHIVNSGNSVATALIRFIIDPDPVAAGAVPSDSQLEGIVAECKLYAEAARSNVYGSPLTASAAADMIDTSKVYVYTGDETGYTAGHWYYYNGTAWADGGVYNSIAFQTDTTLTLPDHAADAKATGDALATKADKIGNIALAERLYGGEYTSESETYHFRQAPEGMGAKSETIVGGSLGWNQLCNDSSVTVQSGHKYIAKISGAFSIGASTGTAITGLTSGTDMVIDLTTCFGSTIADYIYTLEQSTAGAGVAWVKRYIDLDTYHEYDAGSIQSVEGLASHDVVGFNQWDEEWEVGSYNPTTGEKDANPASWRNKNPIPIIPNTQYYFYTNSAQSAGARAFWYDADGNYMYLSYGFNALVTPPSNARFLNIRIEETHTSDTKLCINISDPSRNGTYEPYEKHSYPLDSSLTLRGVPKLVTDHIEFDGDKYLSDGTVERRYGIVDLGTLDWSYVSGDYINFRSITALPNAKVPASSSSIINALCPKYAILTYVDAAYNDKTLAIIFSGSNAAGRVWVSDSSYTDAASFKAAMSGVMLVYELATPTTETAQPFQSPMIVGATEEYVTTGVVPVGHESKYYEDVAKKVSGLPKDFSTLIAPTEVTFTATRNYSVGNYLIVKNQLYKVTSAISTGGTITPNSNVTATTIMAEILALA